MEPSLSSAESIVGNLCCVGALAAKAGAGSATIFARDGGEDGGLYCTPAETADSVEAGVASIGV